MDDVPMDAIDILESEHRTIRASLDTLTAWTSEVLAARRDGRAVLQRFVELLHGFVDQCHHGKEEDILFRAMIANDPDTNAEVGLLLRAHTEMRQTFPEFERLAFQARPWSDDDRRGLANTAARLTALAVAHMDREERWLFPRARLLPAAVLQEISSAFSTIGSDATDGDKHRHLLELADTLVATPTNVCRHEHRQSSRTLPFPDPARAATLCARSGTARLAV